MTIHRMNETGIMMNAVRATNRLLGNLAESDFVTHSGSHAINEIRNYREDIAVDIFSTFVGREAFEEEKMIIVKLFEREE